MASLTVVSRAGTEHFVNADVHMSLMEAIRDNGLDELLALCGGNCSCATCHVYVNDSFFDVLPPISQEEEDLLDGLACRQKTSRLSCQILISPRLDGMAVAIAPDGD